MVVLDMLIISLIMLIVEKSMLKEKYILLSPYTLGQLSLLYVYIVPFIFYQNTEIYNYTSKLSREEAMLFLVYLRTFYYTFTIFSLISFSLIKNNIYTKQRIEYEFTETFIISSICVLIPIVLLGELRIVNFNFSILFDKMINPRKYTYFREGLGMFTYLVGFSKSMLLYLSVVYYNQKKGLFSKIVLSMSILLTVLGGSKSSLLVVLIYIIVLGQKLSIKMQIIKTKKIIVYLGIMFILLTFSFMLMRTTENRSTFIGTASGIIEYSQEAYYSAKVINDFHCDGDHILTVAKALIFTPMPRNIFPSKGYYGLYNNYWKPFYQPNVVDYHTSTYGFLAEGHMLFSYISPILYALLFNLLFKYIYIYYYKVTSLTSLYIILFLIVHIYFYIRTGLFMATSIWGLIFNCIVAKLFFTYMNIFNKKINNTSILP